MARLKLTIDDERLHRARQRALVEGTSGDAVVRETLASCALDLRVLLRAHEGGGVGAVVIRRSREHRPRLDARSVARGSRAVT